MKKVKKMAFGGALSKIGAAQKGTMSPAMAAYYAQDRLNQAEKATRNAGLAGNTQQGGGTRPRPTPPVIDIKPPPQNYIGPRDAMGYPTSVKPTVTGAPAVRPKVGPFGGFSGDPKPAMTGLGGVLKNKPAMTNKFGNLGGKGLVKTAAYEFLRTQPPLDISKTAGPGAPLPRMRKGGKVSSASKRADGCAVKGKTKGKMV